MSISSTVKTIMPYLKTASGYVLHRLSSQAVEMNDGTTLEQKVTSLNSLISKKVDTSKIVNNCLTTESGFVLDGRQGKELNDKITELNGKTIKFSAPEIASTDLAPDEDGFMIVQYRPEDSSRTISITTYDETSNIVIGAGISLNGARIAYTVPVVAGRSYKTDRSLARGTLTAYFMAIH